VKKIFIDEIPKKLKSVFLNKSASLEASGVQIGSVARSVAPVTKQETQLSQ
jgi:hypothetical protein